MSVQSAPSKDKLTKNIKNETIAASQAHLAFDPQNSIAAIEAAFSDKVAKPAKSTLVRKVEEPSDEQASQTAQAGQDVAPDASVAGAFVYEPHNQGGEQLIEVAQASSTRSDAGGSSLGGLSTGAMVGLGALALGGIALVVANNNDDDSGTTLRLTKGTDTAIGTSQDDLITGVVNDGNLRYETTYQDLDTIDGGAGANDTIEITVYEGGTGTPAQATVMNVENFVIKNRDDNTAEFDFTNVDGVNKIVADQMFNDITITQMETKAYSVVFDGGGDDSSLDLNLRDTVAGAFGVDVTLNNAGQGYLSNESVIAGVRLGISDGGDVVTSFTINSNGGIFNALELYNTSEVATITASGGTDLAIYLSDAGTGLDMIINAASLTADFGLDAGSQSGDLKVTGATGDNFILTGDGADTITSYNGNDSIVGGSGADVISAGAGNDLISGGEGADTITGGAGVDVMEGEAGADTFVFAAGDTATAPSTWTDTNAGSTVSVVNADKILAAAGDILSFTGVDFAAVNTVGGSQVITDASFGNAGDVDSFKGTYSNATGLFTSDTSGADLLVVYDLDGSGAGTTFGMIVLVGGSALAFTESSAGVLTIA